LGDDFSLLLCQRFYQSKHRHKPGSRNCRIHQPVHAGDTLGRSYHRNWFRALLQRFKGFAQLGFWWLWVLLCAV
jgi:hypothetical protein